MNSTSSIVGETPLQSIARQLMGVGRGENNITSKSSIGDLRNNVLVGLGKICQGH
jgi:hypothetical protein